MKDLLLLILLLLSIFRNGNAQGQIVNIFSPYQPKMYSVPIVDQVITESYQTSTPFVHLKSFESLLGFVSMEVLISINLTDSTGYISIDRGSTGKYYQVFIEDFEDTVLRYAKEGLIEVYYYLDNETKVKVEIDRFNLKLTEIDRGMEFSSNLYQAIAQTSYSLYKEGLTAPVDWYNFIGVIE